MLRRDRGPPCPEVLPVENGTWTARWDLRQDWRLVRTGLLRRVAHVVLARRVPLKESHEHRVYDRTSICYVWALDPTLNFDLARNLLPDLNLPLNPTLLWIAFRQHYQ